MRVYYVEPCGGWNRRYYPTREAALQYAQMVADHTGKAVEIEEIGAVQLTPKVLCDILNGYGGWAASQQLLRRVWPTGVEQAGTVEYGQQELE